jgi:hypothetical protein
VVKNRSSDEVRVVGHERAVSNDADHKERITQRRALLDLSLILSTSTAIVRSYGPRLDAFLSEPGRGSTSDAMNKGIALARGEYVLMMNSSDVFASDHALSNLLGATLPGVEQAVSAAGASGPRQSLHALPCGT